MPWARASALARHLECPGASWLPQVDRSVWRPGYLQSGVIEVGGLPEPEKQNTSAADHGTAMHEAKAGTGQDPWLSQVDPWRERLWPSQLGVHEQCVSYDCRTRAIELGPTNASAEEMNAWKASRGDDCVTGTADWWAELPSGEPWIDDLKTGWRRPEVVTPQTLFYLMLRCRLAGWDFGRISITHWPKRDPEPTRDGLWRQVSGLALDAFEDELQAAWRRAVQTANPETRPGPWCGYCPSALVCPSQQKATEQDEKAAA